MKNKTHKQIRIQSKSICNELKTKQTSLKLASKQTLKDSAIISMITGEHLRKMYFSAQKHNDIYKHHYMSGHAQEHLLEQLNRMSIPLLECF